MSLEELKAVLRFRGISYRTIAEEIGINISTFSDKMNNTNGREFTQSEIAGISTYLKLTPEDAFKYFFPDYLRNAI